VVKTMFGRRRLVPELTSRNGQIRSAAERVAVNLPIQGTAADILKRAMIDVHAALLAETGGRTRMILTVHDELLFEAPKEAPRRPIASSASAWSRRRAEGATDGGRGDRRELEGSQELRRGPETASTATRSS
jgi:hypothetical protein